MAGEWLQWCVAADQVEVPFVEVDLSGVVDAELRNSVEIVAAEWQKSLDLEKGPLLRAVYFKLGGIAARGCYSLCITS
jgi:hypothetical protein